MERKQCSRCRKSKPIEEFNWKYKDRRIRHSSCRDCTRKSTKSHYDNHKDRYKGRATDHTREKRKSHCAKIVEYLKIHPCVDCGENDPIVLQFDHVRGKKKDSVGRMASGAYAWSTIQTEIDKCEVRCANCHTRRTAKQCGWKYKTGF